MAELNKMSHCAPQATF